MKSLLAALIIFSATGLASAETYRVNPSRLDRLPEVLETARDGDTIIFEAGVYRTDHSLDVTNKIGVTLKGEGDAEIVSSNLDEAVIAISGSARVKIRDLRARHEKPSPEYACEGSVIEVKESEQVGVSGCALNGCGSAGVWAYDVKDLVVYQNTIFNNSFAALWLYNVTGSVHENKLHDNAADLITSGECEVTLTGNSTMDNVGNNFNDSDFFREVLGER